MSFGMIFIVFIFCLDDICNIFEEPFILKSTTIPNPL